MSNAASSDGPQRADALIARMKEARGYIYPEWEFAARQDPEFVETYNHIYELGLGDGKHVSAKVREFVAIALLAFRGAERAGLVAHMQRAIRLGATCGSATPSSARSGGSRPSPGVLQRSSSSPRSGHRTAAATSPRWHALPKGAGWSCASFRATGRCSARARGRIPTNRRMPIS